jgi:hypothetical protein
VRRAVRELQDDFGFRLGGGNQAYMLDTLPDEVSVAAARPGDLVFYRGRYTSVRKRRQPFDCVHVEVFVGGASGEGTVGARWQRGVVQEWPSLRFDASAWEGVEVTVRSLEPWLAGVCEPAHPALWATKGLAWRAQERRSIFAEGRGEGEGEGAGAGEGEGEGEGADDAASEEDDGGDA